MRSFYFSKMYCSEANETLYTTMINNVIDVQVDIIGSRNLFEDGQLKIVLETILAIDDMIIKEGNSDKAVLVVGSSSEGGVASGYAYEALPLMLRNSEVDLYDPCNNEGEVVVNTVKMKYYKEEKILDKYDTYKYNIILDDGWEENMSRSWDRDNLFSRFPHYSVKWIDNNPDMPKLQKNLKKYYQVFKTGAAECRIVSRLLQNYDYRNIPLLGNCPGCRELKFRLRGSYDDSLYKWFMSCHKMNCIDKTIKRQIVSPSVETKNDKAQVWYRIHPTRSDYSKHKVMYYDMFDKCYNVIPVTQVF